MINIKLCKLHIVALNRQKELVLCRAGLVALPFLQGERIGTGLDVPLCSAEFNSTIVSIDTKAIESRKIQFRTFARIFANIMLCDAYFIANNVGLSCFTK